MLFLASFFWLTRIRFVSIQDFFGRNFSPTINAWKNILITVQRILMSRNWTQWSAFKWLWYQQTSHGLDNASMVFHKKIISSLNNPFSRELLFFNSDFLAIFDVGCKRFCKTCSAFKWNSIEDYINRKFEPIERFSCNSLLDMVYHILLHYIQSISLFLIWTMLVFLYISWNVFVIHYQTIL